jgi:hypothetical protein
MNEKNGQWSFLLENRAPLLLRLALLGRRRNVDSAIGHVLPAAAPIVRGGDPCRCCR